MICPICKQEMRIDDVDCDYALIKNNKALMAKSCWTICDKCNIYGYYETKLSYGTEEGEIQPEPLDYDDIDYSDMKLG